MDKLHWIYQFGFQPAGVVHGVETKFQLTQRGQFIHIESVKERGRHIGVIGTGQLKQALATGKEDHSMFGVRLLVGIHVPFDSCFSSQKQPWVKN